MFHKLRNLDPRKVAVGVFLFFCVLTLGGCPPLPL